MHISLISKQNYLLLNRHGKEIKFKRCTNFISKFQLYTKINLFADANFACLKKLIFF